MIQIAVVSFYTIGQWTLNFSPDQHKYLTYKEDLKKEKEKDTEYSNEETNLVAAKTNTPVKTSTPSNSVRNCSKGIRKKMKINEVEFKKRTKSIQTKEKKKNNENGKQLTNLINNTISYSSIVMSSLWGNRIKFIKKEKARCRCSCFGEYIPNLQPT